MLSGLLLAALLLRAWIPVGFMPASGTPFMLQLCPAVAAVPVEHAHHHHGGGEQGAAGHGAAGHGLGHSHFENCPYGSAPAAGPLSQLLAFEPPTRAATGVFTAPDNFTCSTPPRRAHQPRGPPSTLA